MVLRILIRFLANNEKLVEKLAESRPIRRAAQLTVYMMNHSKSLKLSSNPQEFRQQLMDILRRMSSNMKDALQDTQKKK